MKPKKTEKPVNDESKAHFERLQADHEMFLQAFEKPTQIYRYLRSRSAVSPIFLHRSLSYMGERSTRTKCTRNNFKVNSLLAQVESKLKKDNSSYNYKSEFMNLTFTGFLDQSIPETVSAEVEVSLVKICHKKRKDVSSPMLKINMGKAAVVVNPDTSTSSILETVSIGNQNFSHNNGHSVKSFAIVFRVTCEKVKSEDLMNGICNGETVENSEPPPKRHCHSNSGSSSSIQDLSSNAQGKSCPSHHHRTAIYGAELIVYDKNQRCLLTDGEYELALQDLGQRQNNKKQATWETVMDGRPVGPFEIFNKCPTLKFKLGWNDQPMNLSVAEKRSNNSDVTNKEDPNLPIVPKHILPRLEMMEKRAREAALSPSSRKRIFYQFMYNNNTRQQTEARDDLHCPWCSLPCVQLYPLLKHLRCCHARFNFAFVEHPRGARIDVAINQCYDGAYVGNPQDLHSHIGYSFSRNGPVRRTPVTHVLVYNLPPFFRPKKPIFELGEFTEPETESHSTRQIVQGHNRLYFHTITCQPVRPCEIERDSEDETDPLWLRQKTMHMIDEFTDVNEGEKEVMKMWNLHVMHNNFIADCQMGRACASFIEEYGLKILEKNLYRNFVLHLLNLFDFGLLRPEMMYRSTMLLYQLRNHLESQGLLASGNCSSVNLLSINLGQRLHQELSKCTALISVTTESSPAAESSQELPT